MKFYKNLKYKLNMNKKILVSGSIIGLLAVILGAFAAHGLEKSISQYLSDFKNSNINRLSGTVPH